MKRVFDFIDCISLEGPLQHDEVGVAADVGDGADTFILKSNTVPRIHPWSGWPIECLGSQSCSEGQGQTGSGQGFAENVEIAGHIADEYIWPEDPNLGLFRPHITISAPGAAG